MVPKCKKVGFVPCRFFFQGMPRQLHCMFRFQRPLQAVSRARESTCTWACSRTEQLCTTCSRQKVRPLSVRCLFTSPPPPCSLKSSPLLSLFCRGGSPGGGSLRLGRVPASVERRPGGGAAARHRERGVERLPALHRSHGYSCFIRFRVPYSTHF